MDCTRQDKTLFVRIDKGDDLVSNLLSPVQKAGWTAGSVIGIGALSNIELGIYEPESKSYLRQRFPDTYELLSMTGNIGMMDEKLFSHLHVVLAGADFRAFGGHLFSATVAVTAEAKIEKLEMTLKRKMHDELKIGLLNFS